jgi:hypothetical protein
MSLRTEKGKLIFVVSEGRVFTCFARRGLFGFLGLRTDLPAAVSFAQVIIF